MIDHQVDLVAAEERPVLQAGGQRGPGLGGLRGGEELLGVGDDVRLERVEIGEDGRIAPVAGADLVDEVADRAPGDLLARLADRCPGLALPARERPLDQLAQLLLQLAGGLRQALPFRLGQLLDLAPLEDLAVLQRAEADADRRAEQGDPAAGRAALEVQQRAVAALLEGRLDRLPAVAVLLGLEGGGDGRPQLAVQLGDPVPEAPALAGRERENPRTPRVGEVVDVAPVGRDGLRCGAGEEHLADEGVLADALRAHRVEVEPRLADLHAERQGLDRAVLPDDLVEGREVRRGGEGERGRVGAAGEPVRGEGCNHRSRPRALAAVLVRRVHRTRGASAVAMGGRPVRACRWACGAGVRAGPAARAGCGGSARGGLRQACDQLVQLRVGDALVQEQAPGAAMLGVEVLEGARR